MNDNIIESMPNRQMQVGMKCLNEHFVFLVYTKFFSYSTIFVNYVNFNRLGIETKKESIMQGAWVRDPNYKHLINSTKCYHFHQRDHNHLLSLLQNEINVLLNNLKSFKKSLNKPNTKQVYYDVITNLNVKWKRLAEKIPEILRLEQVYAYFLKILK